MTGKKLKDPPSEPELPDLVDQQADFFEDYFKKGAEFTRALIAENEALRRRLAAATDRHKQPEGAHSSTQNAIERDHYDLACLFVAQGQLARARDAGEVVDVIAEILLNFVGAERFVLYAADSTPRLRPIFASSGELDDLDDDAPALVVDSLAGALPLGRVASRPLEGPPLTAFRLTAGGEVVGAVGVWSYLVQKTALVAIDEKLFALVSDVGGTALESARIRGQSPRIAGPPDYFSGLALLLGIGGRGG